MIARARTACRAATRRPPGRDRGAPPEHDADTQFYFDYFTGLLHRSPETRVVADVTPSYGICSGPSGCPRHQAELRAP